MASPHRPRRFLLAPLITAALAVGPLPVAPLAAGAVEAGAHDAPTASARSGSGRAAELTRRSPAVPAQVRARVAARHTAVGSRVLTMINAARAVPRMCGDTHYRAVPALHANARLGQAARGFATRMAQGDFFDHVSPDGSDPGSRIAHAGYRWMKYGEDIGAGYGDPASVVAAWLASPDHCANVMGTYHDVGFGYAFSPGSTFGSYWVLDFGSR